MAILSAGRTNELLMTVSVPLSLGWRSLSLALRPGVVFSVPVERGQPANQDSNPNTALYRWKSTLNIRVS